MSPAFLWLALLALPPLVVAALAAGRDRGESVRRASIFVAGCCTLVCAAVLWVPALAALRIGWPWGSHPLLGASLLRVTSFSSALVPLPSVLWLLSVSVTPRSRIDAAGLGRTALAALFSTLAFLTESPALLVLLWTLLNVLFLRALGDPKFAHARRVAGAYLGASTACLAVGVVLKATAGPEGQTLGLYLVAAAVLLRKGIFPCHAWIPEVFEHGRLGPALRFSAPQLGSYAAVVLILPDAPPGLLRLVAILSLVTSVYGAALALVQSDARRAAGYLFVSQSALVLTGIDCTTEDALAGSLVLWLSSALAFTALGYSVLALEVRRGRLDLTRHHGGYEQMPLLAASFLVLGLACTGFPGTLGFVGEEMLIEGAVHDFPALGFQVIVASALTGLAVLRMYFSLFCGARPPVVPLRLRRRENVTFGAVAAGLVFFGLAPEPVAASRLRASEALLEQRSERRSKPAPPLANSSHSARSASTGWSRAAWRAGTTAAKSPPSSKSTDAASTTRRSTAGS